MYVYYNSAYSSCGGRSTDRNDGNANDDNEYTAAAAAAAGVVSRCVCVCVRVSYTKRGATCPVRDKPN